MNLSLSLVRLFFPHESNNHKAKLLHSSSILGITILLIFYQLFLLLIPKTGVNILGYASNISIEEVVSMTNNRRIESGLPPLENNPQLALAAKAKGENMLASDYWAHVSPDGTEPWRFFKDVGYKYRFAGENLARDFSNTTSAVDAWMASPTHRENMLSAKYKEIGVAVVEGDLAGVDTTIIVQFFGTKYADVVPEAVAQGSNPQTVSVNASPTPLATPYAEESQAVVTPATNQPVKTQPPMIVYAPETEVSESSQILISPFGVTRGMSLIIVGILMLVLIVDAVLVSRRRIARIAGRTYAHLSFLGMILAIAIILQAGRIL